jgi:hypothetical protein
MTETASSALAFSRRWRRRCGLKVKALLPAGQAVALRDMGITVLPFRRLNMRLSRHEHVIHATKGGDPKRFVACTAQDGQVEHHGLFELRQTQPRAPGRTNGR